MLDVNVRKAKEVLIVLKTKEKLLHPYIKIQTVVMENEHPEYNNDE